MQGRETHGLAAIRTMLFVPGDRPDRFAKALASGADSVIFDLEDAVGPSAKDEARRVLAGYFGDTAEAGGVLRGIRVNNIHTVAGLRDLEALATMKRLPDFVALPKVEAEAEVLLYARHLAGRDSLPELLCTIETALGLERAVDIARASPQVTLIGFGGADLANDLDAEPSWENMLPARMRVIQAAAAARIAAMDVPWFDIGDDAGLDRQTRQARALGFRCKLAIHPRQVPVIAAAFAPGEEAVSWARRVVAAFAEHGGRAFQLDGRMIDEPIYRQQLRILVDADRRGQTASATAGEVSR